MADVEVERVGQVALLRLNRVDQRNAIGGELLGLLIERPRRPIAIRRSEHS